MECMNHLEERGEEMLPGKQTREAEATVIQCSEKET